MKEKEFLEDFAKRLRQMMIDKRMTQVELVEKTWMSRKTIYRCLQGNTMPSLDTFVNLVFALGVEPRELANLYWRID